MDGNLRMRLGLLSHSDLLTAIEVVRVLAGRQLLIQALGGTGAALIPGIPGSQAVLNIRIGFHSSEALRLPKPHATGLDKDP